MAGSGYWGNVDNVGKEIQSLINNPGIPSYEDLNRDKRGGMRRFREAMGGGQNEPFAVFWERVEGSQAPRESLERRIQSIERQISDLESMLETPYELVLGAADGIMKDGTAVSAGVLSRKLGLNKKKAKLVKQYLERAVKEGRYDVRTQPMFAFDVKFSVYSPKGSDLPYLPSGMTLKDYDSLLSDSLGIVYSLPDSFTQQKFHDSLKSIGKSRGINAKSLTMSVPSILGTYVKKGILETDDGNNYRKNYNKV